MGKAALLAVGAFVVMSTVYGVGTSTQLLATQSEMASYNYQEMLRNAAVTGFNMTKQKLADRFQYTVVYGAEGDAMYNSFATVNTTTKVATITSTAQMDGPDGETLQYAVYARVQLTTKSPETVPGYQRYLLLSEKDLTLNGDILLDTLILKGTTTAKYNADVHTNGKLTVTGNKAEIRGFGTYVTTKSITHTKVFKPYYNPAREAVVKQSPRIALPIAKMHPDSLKKNLAFDKTTSSTLALLPGTYDHAALGATREDPYVWYIDGDLSLVGDASFKGYTILVVNGNVELNGNVTLAGGLQNAENNLMIIALDPTGSGSNGDITMHGSTDYWGQYMARNDVTFGGTPNIYGNIVAGGEAEVNGTPNLYYIPASPGLTQIFEGPDTRLKLLSYSERDLTQIMRSN